MSGDLHISTKFKLYGYPLILLKRFLTYSEIKKTLQAYRFELKPIHVLVSCFAMVFAQPGIDEKNENPILCSPNLRDSLKPSKVISCAGVQRESSPSGWEKHGKT